MLKNLFGQRSWGKKVVSLGTYNTELVLHQTPNFTLKARKAGVIGFYGLLTSFRALSAQQCLCHQSENEARFNGSGPISKRLLPFHLSHVLRFPSLLDLEYKDYACVSGHRFYTCALSMMRKQCNKMYNPRSKTLLIILFSSLNLHGN